jgi:UDP-N-acetylmuramoyl-tripeptide--D-alanyl-D-alanine ligase
VLINTNKSKHMKQGVISFSYGAKEGKDITASQIKLSRRGMTFQVTYEEKTYDFETKLLGYHNINNILSGILLGFKLGMSYNEIYIGVRTIETVEHRLELSRRGVYTLIDDAYNSNPEGAKMALDVLAAIDGNHKILITPGMIELGDEEYQANHTFGKQMSKVCNYIILVGKKQTAPIQKGLVDAGYPMEKCTIVSDIFEAYAHLSKIVIQDDVVLIENDLPDNYNE